MNISFSKYKMFAVPSCVTTLVHHIVFRMLTHHSMEDISNANKK